MSYKYRNNKPNSHRKKIDHYTARKLSTGFTTAAFAACQLTTTIPVTRVTPPAIPNVHHGMEI